MSSFWLILKQQWTIEEISIFSNSSHLEWRAVQCFPRCFYFYRTFGLVIEFFLTDQTNFYQTEKNWQSKILVLVIFDQLIPVIPVILSADKTMKRQRMILFPRASSKTFNQIFISVYMYFDYWSLAYLCCFLQVPSPFFSLLKY